MNVLRWLLVQSGLAAAAALINGLFCMLILNPVFHLHVGYWGWFGVSFVITDMVSKGVALRNYRD